MILNPSMEAMPLQERTVLQNKRLHAIIDRVYRKTDFYHNRLSSRQLKPDMVQTAGDVQQLPFLSAPDISANYPYGLLTVPVSAIARFQHGATNKAIGLTQQDIASQLEMLARSLVACNVSIGSVFMAISNNTEERDYISALQGAAEGIGVTVIQHHTSESRGQLKALLEFGVTVLFADPDILLHLAEVLGTLGFSTADLPLISLLCDARRLTDNLRNALQQSYDIPIYALYGHEDIFPLGIASECLEKNGLHLQEDHFFPEIIDPHTGEPIPDGQIGELVVTTLTREGMPLIRYRTGDSASLDKSSCSCGRTSARLQLSFPVDR